MEVSVEHRFFVDQAFASFLDPYLSAKARERIAARFGEEIAEHVRAIYDEALNEPVDWKTMDMDKAVDAMDRLLDARYPWLGAEARRNLKYAFMMEWK